MRRTLTALTLGAVVLRLMMFLGRGDYVAFDEAWYLLLGQSMWSGEGYRLSGLRHIALSPLFPVLAGGLGRLSGDPIWAGRIVAAITSGLLVLPCWSIFRRLAGRRTAMLAGAIVALAPSLAPFVAPEWVGWDLWVGAEPVYHLFLYSGIAFTMRALERRRVGEWLLAGGALALAYLARPEVVVVTGLLGLLVVAWLLVRRNPRALVGPAVVALAFIVVAAPYWFYLHDVTGRWTLTGRAVQVGVAKRDGPSASTIIEGMLWEGRHGAYVRNLYALDPSGTRLASSYWGVPEPPRVTGVQAHSPSIAPVAAGRDPAKGGSVAEPASAKAAPFIGEDGITEPDPSKAVVAATPGASPVKASPGASRPSLYLKAFGKIVPGVLVPFILLGILAPRRRLRAEEFIFIVPLLAGSLLIARIVAIDPRTQLFLVPALAFYAARGVRAFGVSAAARIPRHALRPGLVPALLVLVVVSSLAIEDMRRLYMSSSLETTHQFVAAENRRAGEELRRIIPEGKTVMSFHPAVALQAGREWRALPMASLPAILLYAQAVGSEYVVLSAYNPSPIETEQMPRPYLVVPVPEDAASVTAWMLTLAGIRNNVAIANITAP